MTYTSDPLNALLGIRDGSPDARWNFPLAAGSPIDDPAGIGAAVTLNYSFLTAAPSSEIKDFRAFNSTEMQATREILAAMSTVANITFVETATGGTLTFAVNDQEEDGTMGYAYYPEYTYSDEGGVIKDVAKVDYAGGVWMSRYFPWTANAFQPGGSGYSTLIHEIGHALGLRHPFVEEEDEEGEDSRSSESYALDTRLDNLAYTLMSYTQHPYSLVGIREGAGEDEDPYLYVDPETLMHFDIAALQYLYGANTSYATGDDVYTFLNNRPLIKTIWDAGGVDTFSAANFTLGCVIDLRAGAHSSLFMPALASVVGDEPADVAMYNGTDNVAIAFDVLIENAIGGSGADRITGNSADNVLDGAAGADTMTGGDGSDVYYVDNAGDVVIEAGKKAAVGGIDTVCTTLAFYTLGTNIENGRILATGSATLTGNALNNLLYAGPGDNIITGGKGIDTLSYRYLDKGVTVSLLNTAAQTTATGKIDQLKTIENLIGTDFDDVLIGSGAANTLIGGKGRDVLTGGKGKDIFVFTGLFDSGSTENDCDVITDFERRKDRIDLSLFDADSSTAEIDRFSGFIDALTEFTAAGQLKFSNGVLYGNIDADSAADFLIKLTGITQLGAADLIV